MVPAAASSSLREPAQTLRSPGGALCRCIDESPSAWIPSRQPLGTAARHWQSNFSAIAPNLRPRSAIPIRSALPRWTTPTLPPPSPGRRATGSTPYSATRPTDAPDPMGMSNNDPARHGRSTDEPHSNKSHSAHGYASGPIPSRQYCGGIGGHDTYPDTAPANPQSPRLSSLLDGKSIRSFRGRRNSPGEIISPKASEAVVTLVGRGLLSIQR